MLELLHLSGEPSDYKGNELSRGKGSFKGTGLDHRKPMSDSSYPPVSEKL